jgi:hypothetical protein
LKVLFGQKSYGANIMKQDTDLESAYRDQWLALLDWNGVRRPAALQVIAVPGIVAQLTKGEPSGSLDLDESPGNVLMVNLSPVQALQQVSQPAFFCERHAALGYDAHANGDPE